MRNAILLFMACGIAAAQWSYSEGKTGVKGASLNVLSVSGINLRQEPTTTSKVLVLVPYGAKLTIEEVTDRSQDVDNFRGRFVKVTYKGKTGYLFAGFLSSLPAPDLKKPTNLDGYAVKYLGKGAKKGAATVYPNGIIHEVQSGEGSYAQKLTVPNISLEEGFLIARALASTLDAGFTGREPFPKKNATYDETVGGKKIQTEVTINKIESGTFHGISKTMEAHIFMISVASAGKGRVLITLSAAD